jgi:hypothetical protein
VNHELSAYFRKEGILDDMTAPYTPEQHGVAERLNWTFNDRVRAMLLDADVDLDLWAGARQNSVGDAPWRGPRCLAHALVWGKMFPACTQAVEEEAER